MGYLQHKYNRSYFLKEDDQGNPCVAGAEGADTYRNENGRPRDFDKAILSRINFKGKNVLDLGCGRGEATKYAKEQGAARVIGIDFSQSAHELAQALHQKNHLDIELHCLDVLAFLRDLDKHVGATTRFDVVIMLDFVEHVPRSEFGEILTIVRGRLNPRAVIVLNTPIFAVDNDVLAEGLKPEAMDSSDQFELTAGMHCNRYTLHSLQAYFGTFGFRPIAGSGHFFVQLPQATEQKITWQALAQAGYQVATSDYRDQYEVAETIKGEAAGQSPTLYVPSWQKITSGPLAGREVFLAIDLPWQQEALRGGLDHEIFNVLKTMNLQGQSILDIGGHIGVHAMYFADLVGPKGKVYTFEPNPRNVERMRMIWGRNQDLAERIELIESALGDRQGQTEFSISSQIDNGYSSGSFVCGVDTPYDMATYREMGFQVIQAQLNTLDNLYGEGRFVTPPAVVKIDVERAEILILRGAKKFLAACHPTLFIELHNIACTLQALEFFQEQRYELAYLSDQAENRIFVKATYAPQKWQTPEHALAQNRAVMQEIIDRALTAIDSRKAQISRFDDLAKQAQKKLDETEKQRQLFQDRVELLEKGGRETVKVFVKGLARRTKRVLRRVKRKILGTQPEAQTAAPAKPVRLDFYEIYRRNTFGSAESHSGEGSTLLHTKTVRAQLPRILKQLDADLILDVPCGDFNWMRLLNLGEGGVRYIGGDVVADLITRDEQKFHSATRSFQKLDLIHDPLPACDVIFCRDCLVHLPYADIFAAIANIKRSGARWLMTTTFTNHDANQDLFGIWRRLNLQKAPFNFSSPHLLLVENCPVAGNEDKSLGVWAVKDLPDLVK